MEREDDRNVQVSGSRLWQALEEYATYGASERGGVNRPVFSDADLQARQRLANDCAALGLPVRIDPAANLFCIRSGSEGGLPSIVIGSHLDSVPDGGRFDGALGVLCALEVMRTLVEHGKVTRHPLQLASFTGEEATSFGTSTFGSRALAGRLPDLSANTLPDGRTVAAALRDSGGDWLRLSDARQSLGPIASFLEVHLEQGTRLERSNHAVGVVSGVTGIYRHRIVFSGTAGHAGTSAMEHRRDALRAAAHLILAVAEIPYRVAAADPAATATVGFLEVTPNSPNVIPGRVTLTTDLRSADSDLLATMAEEVIRAAHRAATLEHVDLDSTTVLNQAPLQFDSMVRRLVTRAATGLSIAPVQLASRAGHDAVHLQALGPSGMLFVRCAGGVSHHPLESVTPEDAAEAAQALLQAVLALDAVLDRTPEAAPIDG